MYIYVFVRLDLPLAQQIVQVGHACHSAGNKFNIPNNTNLVLFGIKDEEELKDIGFYLKYNKVQYFNFFEPDIDAHTAICTESNDKRKLFRKFKLWKQ